MKIERLINKIHQGDCLNILKKIPKGSIKGIITSPPYNLRQSTGGGMHNGKGGKWSSAALLKGYDDFEDEMPHLDYVKWQRKCLNAMMKVLQPDGVIFYNHKWRVQGGLLQDRSDIVKGFPVRQIIIWKRSGGINFNKGYFLPTYEVIYMITKQDFVLSEGANKYGDVWEIPQERHNSHPAPFPLEIPRRCIKSIDDGIILDPFMGSGTTALAAIELGLDWIGIEKSQKYCSLAVQRIQKYNENHQTISGANLDSISILENSVTQK